MPAPRSIDVFARAPWRHLLDRVLAPARSVPTMLSDDEQRLYVWLSAIWAQGAGEIVDLGCFAGGSTARLALGRAMSGLPVGVHAYDRFTADEGVKQKILYPAGLPLFAGNDILPIARRMLEPWQDAITLYPGEIEDNGWDGGPIEVLTLDAAKSASAMDAISAEFFPHLVSGQSVVVQQDALFWRQPWIVAQMEMLSDHFTPVAFCAPGSIVYLCRRAPDAATLAQASFAHIEDDRLIDWLSKARTRLARYRQGMRLDQMIQAVKDNPRTRDAWSIV